MNHSPRLQALVLAERIYTDQQSQNKIIAGTYNRLNVRELGGLCDLPGWLFISLTDLRLPELKLEIRYVDMSDLGVLFTIETKVSHVVDPLQTLELVTQMPRFPVPHEGVYDLELYVDGERLGSHRITVALQRP